MEWDRFRLVLAGNGVKQDGVLRPFLFCLHIDGLLVALSRACVGCFLGSNSLVRPPSTQMTLFYSRHPVSTLRIMLIAICDHYAKEYSISLMLLNKNAYSFCLEIGGGNLIL